MCLYKSHQGGVPGHWLKCPFLVLLEPGETSWSSKNDTDVRDLVKGHFLGSPKPVTAKPLPSTAGEGWLLLWALLFLSSLGTSGLQSASCECHPALGAHLIVTLTSAAKAALSVLPCRCLAKIHCHQLMGEWS